MHIYLNIISKMYSSFVILRLIIVSLMDIFRQWSPVDRNRRHRRSPQSVHFYRRCRSVWWLTIFQKTFTKIAVTNIDQIFANVLVSIKLLIATLMSIGRGWFRMWYCPLLLWKWLWYTSGSFSKSQQMQNRNTNLKI